MQDAPEVIFLLFLPTRWKIRGKIQLYFLLFPEEVTRKVFFLPVFPLALKYYVGCNGCSLHPILAKVFLFMTRAHPRVLWDREDSRLLRLGDVIFLPVTTVRCPFTCIGSFSGLETFFPKGLLGRHYSRLQKCRRP